MKKGTIQHNMHKIMNYTGVGTLEIFVGIYNTAGFLQRDSWWKDTNIITCTSKMQALGSLA